MINKNQSGRTMMEMLGVITIMGIITYGAITGINSGMTSYRVNQLYIEIGNIITGMQDMYFNVFGRNSYPNEINCNTDNNNGCDALIDNGILPTKNGVSTIKGLEIKINNNHQLYIKFQGRKEICERLMKMDWNAQSIDCKDNVAGNKCSDNGANCCSNDGINNLYFLPK